MPGCNSAGMVEKSYPRPRSGVAAERSYPASEVGAAAGRSYPTSKEPWLHWHRRA